MSHVVKDTCLWLIDIDTHTGKISRQCRTNSATRRAKAIRTSRAASAHHGDADNLLIIGREIRDRHLNDVLAELNTMIEDCAFDVHSIKN